MLDLRYAVRPLLQAKGFTVASVLTCGLGMGINTAVFSVVDRMLFRPLPYAEPERLVQLHHQTVSSGTPYAVAAVPRLEPTGGSARRDLAVADVVRAERLLQSAPDPSRVALAGVASLDLRREWQPVDGQARVAGPERVVQTSTVNPGICVMRG